MVMKMALGQAVYQYLEILSMLAKMQWRYIKFTIAVGAVKFCKKVKQQKFLEKDYILAEYFENI